MNKFFCFIVIFFNTLIFASTKEAYLKALQEKEPNNLFDNCVNIISGNFVYDDDIVVEGKEPIKFKRSYFSLNNFDERSKDAKSYDEYILAGWSYHNLIKAFFYGDRIDIVQPSCVVYSFKIPYKSVKKKSKHKADVLQNLEYLQTSYLPNFTYKKDVKLVDPKDLIVQLKGQNELFVFYPDGTQKYYKKENDFLNEYLLRSETLLNHNKIEYFYDKMNRIIEIRSTNPQGNKIYAWIKFSYFHSDFNYNEKNKDKYDFVINTSDGKKYEFRHNNYYPLISSKERSSHPFFILENVHSNQFNENLSYHLGYKRTHPLLKSVILPNKTLKEVDYYLLGNKNFKDSVQFFDINDYRFERVKTLQEPAGIDGSLCTTYRFYYDMPNNTNLGFTTIYDNKDNKYVYYYNLDLKIEKIQRYENSKDKYVLINEERYIWKKIRNTPILIAKSFLDANLNPVFAKRYFYDENNNLVEEKIYGNISGNSNQLVLDAQNLPEEDSNVFSKKYKYTKDKKNLLIEEVDDSNIKTQYTYLPSNAIASKIISHENEIKQRFFYEYDEDNNLVKEIEDDSSFYDKNDISNITYRKIKYYYPKPNQPFIGVTEAIEEKYLDLKTLEEKLIKKEIFTFSNSGKIIKKDVYNGNNQFIYFLSYEYDEKGNLITKVDEENKKYLYQYDSKNNKVKEIYPNGTMILNSYNFSNQLTKKEIKKDKDSYELQYFYDINKNQISFIDDLNNETKYEYDNFSNLKKQIFLKLINEKSSYIQETYIYDEKGNITQINQDGNITQIIYNIYSKPISIIYPDNTKENFIYNLDGTLKIFIDKEEIQTYYNYDYLKRVISKIIKSPTNEILQQEEYKYNSYALVEEKNKKETIKYYYDYYQRLIKKEIICGSDVYTEEYFYDDLFRICKTVFNNTYVEINKKDFLGRIVKIEKTELNGNVFYKKEFNYDDFGNISIISYIDGKKSKERHYFDSFGRVLKIEDAIGNEITYNYDNHFVFSGIHLNKVNSIRQIQEKIIDNDKKMILLEKKNSDGKIFYKEENYFDGLNNLSLKKQFAVVDGQNQQKEIHYFYDNMNRLTLCIEKDDNFEKETKYSYTKKGYVKSIIKPDGVILEKEYDYLGNLIQIKSSDRSCNYQFEYNNLDLPIKIIDLVNNLQITRKYNDFGNLIEERLANDLEIKKEYDLLGRKINILYPDNSSTSYDYNPYYLQKVTRKNSFGKNKYYHEYIKYDLSGNVLQERLMEDLGVYQFDSLGRYNLINIPFDVEKIKKYDQIGGIERINWKISCGENESTYKYDNFNEIIKQTGIFEENINSLSNEVLYDQNGNITYLENENEKIFYTYDSLNRLIKVQKEDRLIEFLYDGLNRKILKKIYTLNNTKKIHISTLKYLYDEFEEIGVYNDENEAVEMKIFGKKENNSIVYEILNEIYVPICDIFGNINSLVSLNRGLVEDYKYSFWKENFIYLPSGKLRKYFAFSNPCRYLEKQINDDANLLYFDTSFYDPLSRKILHNNPIDLLIDDPNVVVLQMQIESSYKKNEVTFLEVAIDKPFLSFGFNLFTNKLTNSDKENVKFTKEIISYITQQNIPMNMILEAIKNPKDIDKIEDSKFCIIYENYKILIDMQTREILNIEKI